MTDDLHDGFLPDSAPCPQCGVKPVFEDGEMRWFHKHDCVLHWRKLKEKNERADKKNAEARKASEKRYRYHQRRERIDYWIYRWSIKDIIFTILCAAFVIWLVLFFLGVVGPHE